MDMLTYHEHIKKPKLKYWFCYDFILIVSLWGYMINSYNIGMNA